MGLAEKVPHEEVQPQRTCAPKLYALLLAVGVCSLFCLSYGPFRLEDLQFLFFPLILVAYWGVLRQFGVNVPKLVFFAALVLWLLSGLHLKGLLPDFSAGEKVYLTRLQDDSRGEMELALLSGYNRIAPKGGILPSLEHLPREFTKGEARAWLKNYPEALFIVSGERDWLDVYLPEKIFSEIPRIEFSSREEKKLESLGLSSGDVLPVRIQGYPVTFAVGKLPSEISLATRPLDLAIHYLPWLAQALRTGSDFENSMAERKIAFDHARSVEGLWRGLEPVALANYGLGSAYLLSALNQEEYEGVGLQCAKSAFAEAAAQAVKSEHPELFALIFNNAALARIASSHSHRGFRKAKFWLWDAITTPKVTRASRIALYNLLLLEELEVL